MSLFLNIKGRPYSSEVITILSNKNWSVNFLQRISKNINLKMLNIKINEMGKTCNNDSLLNFYLQELTSLETHLIV